MFLWVNTIQCLIMVSRELDLPKQLECDSSEISIFTALSVYILLKKMFEP